MKNQNSYLRLRAAVLLAVFFLFATLVSDINGQSTPKSPVPLPVPFTPIVDNAGVIDDATQQRLGAIYLNLKDRANIEFAVLTVNTTGDLDIFDYSLAVARGWNIGPGNVKGQGLLLVVAIQDRKYFTQIGDHLEGDLPDGLAGQIQREKLVPAFKKGQYSKGIFDTIESYVATLGVKRGFSVEGIDQRKAYVNRPPSKQLDTKTLCCGVLILIFVIIILANASRRGGGGCLEALFWGSLFSNMGSGSRRWDGGGSGWSGGGFGGSGGGGFGGFGGGFGGGGSFGGGGAGGSW